MVALSSENDFVLDLPYPPSVNRIWRSTSRAAVGKSKKVYLAPAYKAWKDEANALLMTKRGWMMRRIKGAFSVDLALCPPKGHPRGDLDNRIKAVLDFLQSATIIDNDKHCQMICAYWAPLQAGCRVTVKPWVPQPAPSMRDVLQASIIQSEVGA